MNGSPDAHFVSHETLSQAVAAIAYRQFVVCLVIWLAVGFPITCQQHGTMMLFDVDQHTAHAGHHVSVTSASTVPICSLGQHQTAPSDMMNLALLGALPDGFMLESPVILRRLVPVLITWPVQLCIHPPDPPPRPV